MVVVWAQAITLLPNSSHKLLPMERRVCVLHAFLLLLEHSQRTLLCAYLFICCSVPYLPSSHTQIDVFSLGVTFAEAVCRCVPLPDLPTLAVGRELQSVRACVRVTVLVPKPLHIRC